MNAATHCLPELPNTHTDLRAWCWPQDRLDEAIDVLSRQAGLRQGTGPMLPPSPPPDNADDLPRWVPWATQRLGLEAQAVETPALGVQALLNHAGPALWQIAPGQFLLILADRSGLINQLLPTQQVLLITPDLHLQRVGLAHLREALCAPHEEPFEAEVQRLMALASVPASRKTRVRQAMLRERLADQHIGQCWMLRLPASTHLWQQLRHARWPQRVVGMLVVFALVYALEIMGWGLIGQTTLNGNLDMAWLSAWALLVTSLIPLNLLGSALDAHVAIDLGRVLKAKLLSAALTTDMDEVKRQGAGHLLARVMESQVLESLALNGGFGVLVSALELLFAAATLAAGAGGGLHLVLLLGWLTLTIALCLRFHHRLRRWTLTRLKLTHELVDAMVGHRTRQVQEAPHRREAHDDQTMQGYLQTSQDMDNGLLPMIAALPRGWMLLGMLGLAPAFLAGTAGSTTSTALAVSFGGMLLAQRALSGLTNGLAALSRALIAWEQVQGLAREVPMASAAHDLSHAQLHATPSHATPLIDASDLSFAYGAAGAAGDEFILKGLNLRVQHGERILLEGASGGGKSTLASLLLGLRTPTSGLLLLNGLDRHTLGSNWQRLVGAAPQFHENHILTGPLAFNLLMGRQWPASAANLAEAKALCVSLGLGPLIERMPAGLMQQVGETGWQLSHGERSRIFLARALLQGAPLTVLDESFAALDPQTLSQCLRCALERARTLIVVAHP